MSRYMMFIIHSEDYRNVTPPKGLMDAMEKFVGEGLKNGTLVDTAGLQPAANGTRIRSRSGKLKITDGPFSEAKEVVGGYALVEATSREQALDIATQFVELHRIHWPEFEVVCEMRPLETFEAPPA